MAKNNFSACVEYVIKSEGSEYTNDPHDPGGPTKWGITLTDVRLHIKKGATANDVRRLTKGQAITVYREKYWDALNCDDLPAGLDYSVFDYGVNSGIGRSAALLRKLMEMPVKPSTVTDKVALSTGDYDIDKFIILFNTERLCFLHDLRIWEYFGKGWGRRVVSVKKISRAMDNPFMEGSVLIWKEGPSFGPGKGVDVPAKDAYNLEIPSPLTMAFAWMGGAIALRNRRT